MGPGSDSGVARPGGPQLLPGRVTRGLGLRTRCYFTTRPLWQEGATQRTVKPCQRPPHLPHALFSVCKAHRVTSAHLVRSRARCTRGPGPAPLSRAQTATRHPSRPRLLAFFEEGRAVGLGVASWGPASAPPYPRDMGHGLSSLCHAGDRPREARHEAAQQEGKCKSPNPLEKGPWLAGRGRRSPPYN